MRFSKSTLGMVSGIIMVVSASIFYGTIPIFSSLLSREGVGVWIQVGARLGITALIFGLIGIGFKGQMRLMSLLPSRRNLRFALLNGAFVMGAFVTYIAAVARSTPTKVVLISYLYPLFVLILARIFLREPLTASRIGALLLGVVGIAITVEVWTAVKDLRTLSTGDLLALLNAVTTSGAVLIGRWWRSREETPALNVTFWTVLGGFFWLLVLALLDTILNGGAEITRQIVFPSTGLQAVLLLSALAVLGTAVPYFLFYTGLGRVPSSAASILMLPEVISVFVFSAIFLGQGIALPQLVGGAVILTAGALTTR